MDAVLIMQNELFNEPREEYMLFSAKDRRVILRQTMNEFDADHSNYWLESSLCGHLQWIRASELKVKSYTIKR
jgi:hypothetical protein